MRSLRACVVGGVHGGGCVAGGGLAYQGACMVEGMRSRDVHSRGLCGGGACMAGGTCMVGGVRARKNGNCSGGYASYWNAFLFSNIFVEAYFSTESYELQWYIDLCCRVDSKTQFWISVWFLVLISCEDPGTDTQIMHRKCRSNVTWVTLALKCIHQTALKPTKTHVISMLKQTSLPRCKNK